MLKYLGFLIRYFLVWVIVFQFLRFFFMVFNAQVFEPGLFFGSFRYGIIMDMSVAAYITAMALLFLIVQLSLGVFTRKLFIIIHLIFLMLVLLLNSVDLRLYRYWGERMDASEMFVLNKPGMLLKTFSFWDLAIPLSFGIIGFFLIRIAFRKFTKWPVAFPLGRYKLVIILLLLAGTLIIPIRGGLGIAPLNLGSVYFNRKPFYNHGAVNPVWSFGYSLSKKSGQLEQLNTEQKDQARKLVENLELKKERTFPSVIKKDANVMILILESFTSKFIQLERDDQEVTPFLNKLSSESIYFSNVYASGNRTDKGLVSLLSGVPAASGIRVMADTKRLTNLPNLLSTFEEEEYHTGFFYGGNLDFAGMRALISTAGTEYVVDMNHFPPSTMGAKWGVHDHIMLDTLHSQLNRIGQPFFIAALTLSNHEPFDIPMDPVFVGTDNESKFLNTAHYTDQSVKNFIEKLKKSSSWENLWLIIVADHGHPLPGKSPGHDPEKFEIPMWWTGGAVLDYTVYEKVIAQHDLPALVLGQLGIDHSDYILSQNSLAPDALNYGFYSFKDGAGWVTDSTTYVENKLSGDVLIQSGHKPKYSPLDFNNYLYLELDNF